jgi:calcium-dependent protein kinase
MKEADGTVRPICLSQRQVDCLVNFSRASALEEAVLLDVASQLPLRAIHEWRILFDDIDVDSDGRISLSEISRALQGAGLDEETSDLVGQRLTVITGSMEFSRFVAALIPSCRELLVQHLRDAFNRLDSNGDGFVTTTELEQLLERGKFRSKASQVARQIFEDIACTHRISFERLSKHFTDLCCM